jgi:hypothetical protein
MPQDSGDASPPQSAPAEKPPPGATAMFGADISFTSAWLLHDPHFNSSSFRSTRISFIRPQLSQRYS